MLRKGHATLKCVNNKYTEFQFGIATIKWTPS